MLNVPRLRQILVFALPIVGGMLSQNLLNVVDTAMVGTLGNVALSAVGLGGFANWVSMAFILGLATGVQAMVSRRVGEGRSSATAVPLNGGLLLALVSGVPVAALLIWAAPHLFPLLIDDPDVVAVGVPYYQTRLFVMAAVACNYVFRGYWNGIKMSGVYMRTLIAMHSLNIFLNWLLIFGNLGAPELGVQGAAVGTSVAVVFGTFLYFVQAISLGRDGGFLRGLPDIETVKTMLTLSVPAGVQQFFYAAGNTAFFWIAGKIGTDALAASQVLVTILLVAMLPGIGFGMAATTFVGEALGRDDVADARRWGWEVAGLGTTVIGFIALPALIAPDLLLGFFLHDPATLALARAPMRFIAATLPLDVAGAVLMLAHQGAGATRLTAIVSVGMQWVLFLPVGWFVAVYLDGGLFAVWAANMGYRMLQALIYAVSWRGDRWSSIRV